jgi:hypothetical protein
VPQLANMGSSLLGAGSNQGQVLTAEALGIDPRNPVRIKTITDLVGAPDSLRRNVAQGGSKPFFDDYVYDPLDILVDPRTETVVGVSGPNAWWQEGMRNKAAEEKRRSRDDQTSPPSVDAANQSSRAGRNPIFPSYTLDLAGANEVRIRNPNEFRVTVGLRSAGNGRDFIVGANETRSVQVPNGDFNIYFQYSTDPDGLYQGDSFSLYNNGVEIEIVKVVNGNYGIRRVVSAQGQERRRRPRRRLRQSLCWWWTETRGGWLVCSFHLRFKK